MANRNFTRAQALNKEVKILAGTFTDTAKTQGLGYTVANTGTGEYTVTLDDAYPAILSVTANCSKADSHVVVVSITGSVIVLHVVADTVETDLVSAEFLCFTVIAQNSSLPSV